MKENEITEEALTDAAWKFRDEHNLGYIAIETLKPVIKPWLQQLADLKSQLADIEEQNQTIQDEASTLQYSVDRKKAEIQELESKLAESEAGASVMLQMLRAFRYSMDSNMPFPSRDKLDEVISNPTNAGKAMLERVEKLEAENERYRNQLRECKNFIICSNEPNTALTLMENIEEALAPQAGKAGGE